MLQHRTLLRLQALFVLLFLAVSTLPVTLAGASSGSTEGGRELPAEPTGLQVETEAGSLDVSVDWEDVDGATRYLVRWRVAAAGEVLNEGVEVESSEAVITVGGYGEWVVRVQACSDEGCGSPVTLRVEVVAAAESESTSTPATPRTPTPTPTREPVSEVPASEPVSELPGEPSGLQVETEAGSLDVSVDWEDVDGATRYLVRWRVAAAGEVLNEGMEVESSEAVITVGGYGEWVVRVEACSDEGCGSPATQRFAVVSALPPYFSATVSRYALTQDQDIGSLSLPEAAGGAGGFTYNLVPALPEGLSYDPANRSLTGTPAEAGDHAMTYTATDADGTQVSIAFTIAILGTAKQTTLPTPGNLSVERTRLDAPTAPALDVSWTVVDTDGVTITGYKAQYRKKAAEGETAAGWTAYTGALSATATSLNLPGLEAGATYEVQVRVVTAGDEGPWSVVGEGTANAVPVASGVLFNGGSLGVGGEIAWYEAAPLGSGAFFEDGDGDELTYSASAERPALVGVGLSGDAGSAVLRATLLNQGVSEVFVTASDGYGGQVTRGATVTVTATVGREVVEGSPAGTAVGAPVTGTSYNNVALSYTLEGKAKDSGLFVIDSASGQISVAEDAVLDYDTNDDYRETETFNGEVVSKFYRGEVHYTVDSHNSVINVLIAVKERELGQPGEPTLSRTEFSEPTAPALDVSWAAADANGLTITGYEAQYRKKAAEGEAAAGWTAYTGALSATATSLNLPGLEAGATYEVQVRAMGRKGDVPDITLSVNPPSFAENALSNSLTVTATRQGKSGSVTVDLALLDGTATSGIDYAVWTLPDIQIADGDSSGSVILTFTGVNDELVEGSESIIVSGTASGVTVGNAIITIIDEERAGPVITGEIVGPWSGVGEGTANTVPVASGVLFNGGSLGVGGEIAWSEAGQFGSGAFFEDGDGDALTYSASAERPALVGVGVSGDAGSAVLRATLLNQGVSEVFVTASDGYGGQVTRGATVTVTATVGREVVEGSPAGTAVGAPVTGTPYNNVALSYTLAGKAKDSGLFVIDSASGQISVAEDAVLDYDTNDDYRETETFNGEVVSKFYRGEVRYTVDSHNSVINVLIAVKENSAPVITDPGDKSYVQGTAITAFAIEASDADGDTLTVTVTGLPDGLSYDATTKSVSGTVARSAEVKDYTATISADDGTNPAVTETFTVTITNPPSVTLSAVPSSLGEDDGATSVTVKATLNGSMRTSDTVVTIGALAGGATKGTDYTATTLASITIPANSVSGSGSLTITPTDDAVVEGDETITIPGSTTVGLPVVSASVTLTDDDKTTTVPGDKDSAVVSISGPGSNVAEGSDASFTVSLSKAVAAQVVVAWSAPLGTDTAVGSDLGATSGSVTFAANSAAGATQTITITATDDKLSEGSEGFTVTLGAITSTLSSQVSLKSGASSATATISESDAITVNISGPSTVDEGDTTSSYTVSLSPAGVTPTDDLTVSYGTANGTATAGTDYTAVSGTLTFTSTAAGDQTFTVSTTEDSVDEGTGETFTVSISSPSGGGGPSPSLSTTATITTTITDDDDAPTGVALSASPSSLGEDDNATSVTVTATLNGSMRTSDTVVTIGTLAGSATKGTDYTATSLASITIPANTSTGSGSLTITPTDDAVVEGDETITIPGTTTVDLEVTSASVTLTDDDKTTTTVPGDKDSAEVSISGPASDVAEGGNAVFTVTLSKAVAAQVVVAWSAPLSADTAVGSDLSATSGTVTFAANSAAGATQTITIGVTDDKLSETSEGFTVTLGTITSTLSSQVSLKSGASSATATITESDAITVNISGPSTVDEGDTTSSYTVSLSPAGVTPTEDLTVSYATANGTATAGTDYTAKSGTLTFTNSAAGDQTFTVSTMEDSVDEGTGETFTVSISSPSGGGGPSPSLNTTASITTTISDDDDAPTGVTLSAVPSSLGEDDGATSVTVTATLNGSMRTSDTVVTIGALAGGASKGTDYTATSLASITIPANSSSGSGSLTITPKDDAVVEGDETITIPGTTTVDLEVTSASVTLTDDDKTTTTVPGDKDSAVVSISGPVSAVAEGSDASFTVTLSKAVAAQVVVAWSAPLSADTAVGSDLGATSGTVTFAANSAAGATQTITITATDDKLSEGSEGFTVTLGTITSTLSSQVSLKSGASSATATISESDAITVNISGPSSVGEGDTTTSYTVSLSPAGVTPTDDLTVNYATANGTATAGTDYTAKSGTLTFTSTAAGDQTFTVSTTEDSVDEGTGETFTVSISSPSGGGGPSPSLSTTASITTTISDDDDAPTGVTLSAVPSSLGEDDAATSVTVTATLNGSMRTSATVVTIGTLAGGATKGTDYTATSLASITIPANSSSGSGSLTITPKDDAVVEGDETITIPGTTTVDLEVTSASVTLTDDDKTTTTVPGDKDSAVVSISGPASAVAEGSDASFTVTLSKSVAAQLVLAWSAPLSADTAVGSDLSATSGTVTFAANSAAGATQTITIGVTDDALSETSEGFTVTLGTITSTLSSQVSLKSGASSATATISESDAITVNISGPSSVDEGDTTSSYTVSLSPAGVKPTDDLTVNYATANGTATAGTDYTAKSGTLTFTSTAAGDQTFTVSTTEDSVDEGTGETFTVAISSPSGGGGPSPSLSTTATITTTITDDDDAPTGIALSASPSSLGEDDNATSVTVTATLNGSMRTSDTVVTIGTLAGSATEGTDYTATSLASITIPANSASGSGSLTITPTDDAVVEGDETISIPGSTTVDLSVTSASVTLTDDDKTTTTVPGDKDSAVVSISGPAANVAEGGNAVFTVTLSKAVAAQVVVAWSAPLSADTAVGSDLGATSGSVTFAANSAVGATQTITIGVTDDALSETSEGFTVTLGTITSTLSTQVSLKSGASSATATISESDAITVNISGPSTVDEGDTTTSYTVSLSPAGVTPTDDLTVNYATANGTATAGTDYTAKSGTLTFTNSAAGDQTFTVSTTEDSVDEGTGETFTVSISSPSGGGGPSPSLNTTASVTTTISDDDDAPTGVTLSASPSSLGEDDSATSVTVTATLNGSMRTSDTVVTIGTLAGSATEGTDYTATSLASITIPANTASGSGSLTITPTDDAVVEGDETITIPGTTTVDLEVTSASVTLTDDDKTTTTVPGDKDSAVVSISGPAANVAEGGNAVFTVTLSKAVAAQVVVAWSAPLSSDAAVGSDLSATSGTVTFAANSAAGATQTITITATDDKLSEGSEGFTVTLGAITSTLSSQVSLKSGASSASATISESDPITINISGPSTVDEGDTTSSYTVSLSPAGVTPTDDLTVSYATANGTASAGTDYTAKSGTLTFTNTAAGDQTFIVDTTEDPVDEGTGETFTVSISSPSGGGGPSPSLSTTATITTTISDDDDAPTGVTLSASPSSLGEDDSATSVTVTATLNGSTLPGDTVVTIGALAGSATKGTDYTATSLVSITIPATSSTGTGTLTITPTNDEVVEGDETITIPGTTTSGLSVSEATVTLKDDRTSEQKDSAELSIGGPSTVAEGSDASFTVTLSKAVAAPVTVAWSAPLGTDTAESSDLSATSGSVTFAANSAAGATQTITITATDDKLSEGSEGFTVTLGTITSTLSQVSLKSDADSALATISESDPITINISGPLSVDEGDTTTSYTVSLSPAGVTPSDDLTVNYATANDTATAGSDYTAKSGTLTFTNTAAGDQTFTVSTTEDSVDEGTGETFTVSISSPSGGGGPTPTLGTATITTTITDDDARTANSPSDPNPPNPPPNPPNPPPNPPTPPSDLNNPPPVPEDPGSSNPSPPGPGGDISVEVGVGGGTGTGPTDPYPDYTATFDACVGPATQTSPFEDVSTWHAYAADVDCIAYYLITVGTSATTYSPTLSVTREWMALFLTRMARRVGIEVNPTPADAGFADIRDLPAKSQLAINQLADLGITVGTSATTYSPANPVIRGHMALFIARLMNKMTPLTDGDPALEDTTFYGYTPEMVAKNDKVKVRTQDGREVAPEIKSPFTDLGAVGQKQYDAITQLYELGVATGITPTAYGPMELMSRASMAEFMAAALAHSNARPIGLNVQADKTFDYGEYVATVMVSDRDEEFIPVANGLVDIFQNNCVDNCGEDAHFVASGENAGHCNGYQTVGDCIWDTEDHRTDYRGNIFIRANIGPTPSTEVATSRTHTVYAWVGAEDGDVFDVDDDEYASVSASWTPVRDSVDVTTSISSDAASGTHRITSGAPADSGPLVHLGATRAVVVTAQLTDSYGGAVRQGGVEVRVGWKRYVFRRGDDGADAGDTFAITYSNAHQATKTTDDDGKVTFTVNAPRDIQSDTDQDVVDMVTFTVDADGKTDGTANTMGSTTFNWIEDARVYQKTTFSATEYVLVDGDGDEDDDATISVSARLLDQYGDGIEVDSNGNVYRITLTLEGNGSEHFTDVDPGTVGVQSTVDLVKTPSIGSGVNRGVAEVSFAVNNIAATTHSLDIAFQVAQVQVDADGNLVDGDANADGVQLSYQSLTGAAAGGVAVATYVYMAAKAGDSDDKQVTVHQAFGGDDADGVAATLFATEGSGSEHGVLYAMSDNDTYIKIGESPLPCAVFQPEAGDVVRVVVYSGGNYQASIRD